MNSFSSEFASMLSDPITFTFGGNDQIISGKISNINIIAPINKIDNPDFSNNPPTLPTFNSRLVWTLSNNLSNSKKYKIQYYKTSQTSLGILSVSSMSNDFNEIKINPNRMDTSETENKFIENTLIFNKTTSSGVKISGIFVFSSSIQQNKIIYAEMKVESGSNNYNDFYYSIVPQIVSTTKAPVTTPITQRPFNGPLQWELETSESIYTLYLDKTGDYYLDDEVKPIGNPIWNNNILNIPDAYARKNEFVFNGSSTIIGGVIKENERLIKTPYTPSIIERYNNIRYNNIRYNIY